MPYIVTYDRRRGSQLEQGLTQVVEGATVADAIHNFVWDKCFNFLSTETVPEYNLDSNHEIVFAPNDDARFHDENSFWSEDGDTLIEHIAVDLVVSDLETVAVGLSGKPDALAALLLKIEAERDDLLDACKTTTMGRDKRESYTICQHRASSLDWVLDLFRGKDVPHAVFDKKRLREF